jgi:general secretion pathway protein K
MMYVSPKYPDNEQGAVLITVLLLVAVMATIAVALIDDIRFGIRRASNIQASTQATWYAIGSEQLAIEALNQTFAATPDKTTLAQPWATTDSRFPIDGGYIDGKLIDATNCFNLNALVEQDDRGTYNANETSRRQFERLLTILGAAESDAEAMASAATDWIDSDTRPGDRGAEDFDYAVAVPAYRTPNTLIADTAELRAIKGFEDPDFYRTVSRFVCALPTTEQNKFNLNTILPDQAPLIAMLLPEGTPLASISNILVDRSSSGYTSINDFWNAALFDDVAVSDETKALTDIKSSFFTLNTVVVYDDNYQKLTSLIAIGNDAAYVVSREFGELE